MPKFTATVCRTGYGFRTISVEADNSEEAQEKILDEAGNYEYSEKDSNYSIPDGISRELSKQTLKFEYENKSFEFEFTPAEEDWWTAFTQHDVEFDVHYLEDEDNQICVYLVLEGESQTAKTIHTQKIVM